MFKIAGCSPILCELNDTVPATCSTVERQSTVWSACHTVISSVGKPAIAPPCLLQIVKKVLCCRKSSPSHTCPLQVAKRLTEQVMYDRPGADEDVALIPGDFILDRRQRTVNLTKMGMAHAWRWLRALLLLEIEQ